MSIQDAEKTLRSVFDLLNELWAMGRIAGEIAELQKSTDGLGKRIRIILDVLEGDGFRDDAIPSFSLTPGGSAVREEPASAVAGLADVVEPAPVQAPGMEGRSVTPATGASEKETPPGDDEDDGEMYQLVIGGLEI